MALHDPHVNVVIFTVSCFLRCVTFDSCKAINIPKNALSTLCLFLFQPSKHEHDKTKHCCFKINVFRHTSLISTDLSFGYKTSSKHKRAQSIS